MDVAVAPRGNRKVFLLAQGLMPALEMHVPQNPTDVVLSSWNPAELGETVHAPEWTFKKQDLRKF